MKSSLQRTTIIPPVLIYIFYFHKATSPEFPLDFLELLRYLFLSIKPEFEGKLCQIVAAF